MECIILALDPGETTGTVVCSVDGHMDTFTILHHGIVSKWRGIEALIDTYKPTVMVAEQYRLYPQLAATQAYSTIVAARVLGAIEFIAESRGITLVEQAASIGTRVHVPDELYNAEVRHFRSAHEKDAIKHAVAYCYSIGVKE